MQTPPSGKLYLRSEGNLLLSLGAGDNETLNIFGPSSFAVDRFGYFYVQDIGQGEFKKFSPNGDLLANWELRTYTQVTPLDIRNIAIDNQGNLLTFDFFIKAATGLISLVIKSVVSYASLCGNGGNDTFSRFNKNTFFNPKLSQFILLKLSLWAKPFNIRFIRDFSENDLTISSLDR